jgi:molybdopterin synthase catalytic subunit
LKGVTVIHRYGRIAPGEDIVLVVTASSHREAAFAAAEFLMDFLKTRAPFWKQIEQGGDKNWVEAKRADDDRAARWGASKTNHEAAE